MRIDKYITTEDLATISKCSTRKIQRHRDSLIESDSKRPKGKRKYNGWFRMNSKPQMYYYKFLQEFVSDLVFDSLTKNEQQKRTIDCLTSSRYLEQHFSNLTWDYFITVTYKYPLPEDRCGEVIRKLDERIQQSNFENHYRMFYTTEPFPGYDGHHNHIVLRLENSEEKDVHNLLRKDHLIGRVDIEPYNKYLAGLFYLTKKGTQGISWDLFGNRLKQDGTDATKFH